MPFVEESVEPGSVVHTDGWLGYEPLDKKGYQHRIVFLSGRRKQASELLPCEAIIAGCWARTKPQRLSHGQNDVCFELQPAQAHAVTKTPCATQDR